MTTAIGTEPVPGVPSQIKLIAAEGLDDPGAVAPSAPTPMKLPTVSPLTSAVDVAGSVALVFQKAIPKLLALLPMVLMNIRQLLLAVPVICERGETPSIEIAGKPGFSLTTH